MDSTPHLSSRNPFLQTVTSTSTSAVDLPEPNPTSQTPDMILPPDDKDTAPPFYTQGEYSAPVHKDEKNPLFPSSLTSSPYHEYGPGPSMPDPSRAMESSPPPMFPVPESPQLLVSGAGGFTASSYAPTPPGYSSSLVASHPDSPPPSFSRSRAPGLSYAQFKPTFLVARSTTLHKGFPMTSPPAHDDVHPFMTHDINEVDWLQFLSDIRAAGSLTDKDLRRSHLPIISIIPIVGSLSAYGIQKYMKSRKETVVAKLIDSWNHHFFEPRKIRIILMKGPVKLSGADERPIGDLHSPAPSNVAPWTMAMGQEADVMSPGSSSGSNGGGGSTSYGAPKPSPSSRQDDDHESKLSKGKQKATSSSDQNDETFRLFIVPI